MFSSCVFVFASVCVFVFACLCVCCYVSPDDLSMKD